MALIVTDLRLYYLELTWLTICKKKSLHVLCDATLTRQKNQTDGYTTSLQLFESICLVIQIPQDKK